MWGRADARPRAFLNIERRLRNAQRPPRDRLRAHKTRSRLVYPSVTSRLRNKAFCGSAKSPSIRTGNGRHRPSDCRSRGVTRTVCVRVHPVRPIAVEQVGARTAHVGGFISLLAVICLTFRHVAPASSVNHIAISPPGLYGCGPNSVGPMMRHVVSLDIHRTGIVIVARDDAGKAFLPLRAGPAHGAPFTGTAGLGRTGYPCSVRTGMIGCPWNRTARP